MFQPFIHSFNTLMTAGTCNKAQVPSGTCASAIAVMCRCKWLQLAQLVSNFGTRRAKTSAFRAWMKQTPRPAALQQLHKHPRHPNLRNILPSAQNKQHSCRCFSRQTNVRLLSDMREEGAKKKNNQPTFIRVKDPGVCKHSSSSSSSISGPLM